ncbi:NAD(P)/FAD-dependent oxidoreductase [Actinopolymorpha sp. B17G11]|uniref:NAD(P)/FAD-dependent oxidoreductase n=1 Tax=Actinopolymorpha sp. B17G11 TaxID=3160861 RepID=UPI0032E4062E
MDDHIRPRRIVIVGGGFAGLFAARSFRHAPVRVTLIDRAAHHLFQPLLYQCATGILSEGEIAAPFRSVLRRHHNVESLLAEVTDFDLDRRQVIARRPHGFEVRVDYDDLIVAAGVEQSYFGHDEFARYAPGMKSVLDALTIRQKVFGAFELAESAANADERKHWLTFALVGAGPTGVELAGQIRELATHTLRNEYRTITPEDARVLLFDGGDEPLASFGTKLADKTARSLTQLCVELHLHTRVTSVDDEGLDVRQADGRTVRYDAGTILWTAGVTAPAVADTLAKAAGAEQDRSGRIKVAPDLTIPGHPEISVVGDIMSLDRLPGVAEVAMQAGMYAATRIRHQVECRQKPQKPFRYRDLGSAAYIARGRAVMSVGSVRISGFLGWLGWLLLHIAFLTGYRNRVGAVLSWLVAFTSEARRERAFTTRQLEAAREIYAPTAPGPPERPGSPAPPASPAPAARPRPPGEHQ